MDKRCRLCKRKITDPRSQQLGVGPSCAKKEGLSHERPNRNKQIQQAGLFDDVEPEYSLGGRSMSASQRARPHEQDSIIPRNSYASYEAAKREWLANNPSATQAQIELAMRDIARKCGV